MPIARLAPAEAPRAITAAEKSFSAFETLQKAREDARLVGIRAKQAKEEAEAAANAKK